ncbi:hypothetical protein C4577_07710 [Candidatus Parcubacteria bacterium]|nr:MAG: hypothetical protein C4577_07710 [Candidatus Parcubacteria bacterium]
MKSIFSSKTVKDIFIIFFIVLVITTIMWSPHYFRFANFFGLNFSEGFSTIYRNFDGIEYVVIAKTFYNPAAIAQLPQSLPANYYAAHFPGYALAILIFAPLFGFLKSMIFTSLLFTAAAATAFYFLIRDFQLSKHPLFLSLVFLILPARWLVVHSVGSAEPMFIFFTIAAIYFFLKYESLKHYPLLLLSASFGALAQFTRPPGILLFLSLCLYILWKTIKNKQGNIFRNLFKAKLQYFPLVLMPLTLLLIFYWYSIAYQDFFAYFHSGDNIHLTFPPYQVFNQNQFWVGTIWLEDIIYILTLGFLGGLMLFKQKLYPLAFFVFIYLIATTLVAHRDISRYSLPIFPFLLIAFEKVLVSKEFKIVLLIVILAIYLYAQNFLIANTAPIPNPQLFN